MSALRHRLVRMFVFLASGFLLALTLGAAAPAAAAAPVTSYPGSLNGVSALSPSDAWAVGSYTTSTGTQTLVLHWNGARWARVASPNPGVGFRSLTAVTALSPSDAWAVGSYTTSTGGILTLVLHWNGVHWAQVASPSPEIIDGSFLTGVSAVSPADVWAAGWYYGPGGENSNTLVLHWDGTRWAQVHSPNPVHFGFNVLNAVSARSATDAWAAGGDDTGTLLLRWNGYAWQQAASPSPGLGGVNDYLTGVTTLSPSDAWAVGTYSTSFIAKTLVLHWNGTSWAKMASPGPPSSALSSVSAATATDVWAVGSYVVNISGTLVSEPLILHWNGTGWERVPSPNPGGTTGTGLDGVSALSATDAWAVGTTALQSTSGRTVILHWNGTSWTRE